MDDRSRRHSKIVREIVDFSEIFETFALNGKPIFSDAVDTACICFNMEGTPIAFVWGKEFFDSCSDYKAKFILCHEMLHIFLHHGKRGIGLTNREKANVAMDLSINHLLIDEFGFNRSLIEGWESYCWRDTVFINFVPPLPAFESYYALDDALFKPGFFGMDVHDFLNGLTDEEIEKAIDEARKKMREQLPAAGSESAYIQNEIEIEKIKKPKFDKLVKNITSSVIQRKKFSQTSWSSLNRRLCEVCPDLPTTNNMHERKCAQKWKLAFFVDNSGSCGSYLKRFCKTAASLNDKIFEVEVYSFDTVVHKIEKIDGKYKVTGGGGTDFDCIGQKVEETNPDIVFVLTDGYAGDFIPKVPKKYFWFLTECGSEAAIRRAGKIHKLSQYE